LWWGWGVESVPVNTFGRRLPASCVNAKDGKHILKIAGWDDLSDDEKREKAIKLLAAIEAADAADRNEKISGAVVVMPRAYIEQLERVVDVATVAAAKLKAEYDLQASDTPPPEECWAEAEALVDEIAEFRQLKELLASNSNLPSAEVVQELTNRIFPQVGTLNRQALSCLVAAVIETVEVRYGLRPTEYLSAYIEIYRERGR
jgi:ribonuclease D